MREPTIQVIHINTRTTAGFMLLDLPVLHDVTGTCPYESPGCTCWAISLFTRVQILAGCWSQSCKESAALGAGLHGWAGPRESREQTPCFAGSGRKFDHQHRGVCEVIPESYFHSECRDNAPLQSGCFAGLCVRDERGKSVVRSQLLCLAWALRKNFLCLDFMENPYSEW